LIVFGGAIGDFILLCPALSQLATGAPLDIAGPRDRIDLAVAAGIAQRAHALEAIEFHTAYAEPSPRLREVLAMYDRVIAWLGGDPELQRRLERLRLRAETHPGRPPGDWPRHASEFYAHRLNVDIPQDFRLNIAPSQTQHDIVLHPGSGSPTKNWPLDRYLELAAQLEHCGRHIAWSLGPAERDAGLDLPADADLLPPQPLTQLAATLAAATLYIGNDSGITHLAASVGCPTIALFGPTNPDVWAPRGHHVTVVRDMANVTPDAVLNVTMSVR
jgi:ADP-heptose:LPS heptosyltransferase